MYEQLVRLGMLCHTKIGTYLEQDGLHGLPEASQGAHPQVTLPWKEYLLIDCTLPTMFEATLVFMAG